MALRWQNSIYTSALGGNAEFVKSHLTYDWYKPVRWTEDEGSTHSVHARFGADYADAFGDSDSVPYTERFFLGGYKTLRGFDFRGVGPNIGSATEGGEALLNASFEYRLPLYSTTRPGTFDKVEMQCVRNADCSSNSVHFHTFHNISTRKSNYFQ